MTAAVRKHVQAQSLAAAEAATEAGEANEKTNKKAKAKLKALAVTAAKAKERAAEKAEKRKCLQTPCVAQAKEIPRPEGEVCLCKVGKLSAYPISASPAAYHEYEMKTLNMNLESKGCRKRQNTARREKRQKLREARLQRKPHAPTMRDLRTLSARRSTLGRKPQRLSAKRVFASLRAPTSAKWVSCKSIFNKHARLWLDALRRQTSRGRRPVRTSRGTRGM